MRDSVRAKIAERFGAVVLGVIPKDGSIEFGQSSSRALEAGDILLTFGDEESIGWPRRFLRREGKR